MAEGELGGDVELGHGFVLGGEVEERVVAEAFGAAGGGEDFAFDGSVADGEDLTVARGGENAVVAGAALGERDVGEVGDEVEVVALVCGCVRWIGEVMIVGVAGGADAGGSVEGVDFEAGVVCDDELRWGRGGSSRWL